MPNKYLLYHWRRIMNTNWEEAMATPIHVILQDIEMAQLEVIHQKQLGSN